MIGLSRRVLSSWTDTQLSGPISIPNGAVLFWCHGLLPSVCQVDLKLPTDTCCHFSSAVEVYHLCRYVYCGFLLFSDCQCGSNWNFTAPISAWKGESRVNIYIGRLTSLKKESKAQMYKGSISMLVLNSTLEKTWAQCHREEWGEKEHMKLSDQTRLWITRTLFPACLLTTGHGHT